MLRSWAPETGESHSRAGCGNGLDWIRLQFESFGLPDPILFAIEFGMLSPLLHVGLHERGEGSHHFAPCQFGWGIPAPWHLAVVGEDDVINGTFLVGLGRFEMVVHGILLRSDSSF